MKSKSSEEKAHGRVIHLYESLTGRQSAPRPHDSRRGLWATLRDYGRGRWTLLTQTYLKEVEEGRLELVPSAMHKRFGVLVKTLFYRCFERLPLTEAEVARIRSYREKGALVYVMYCRSTLDYLYFNHLFLHADLPLAQFATGIDLAPFLPVREALRTTLARSFYRRHVGPIPDPMDGDRLENLVKQRQPVLIFLTRSRALMSSHLGFRSDPLVKLVELQKKVDFPIYIVPQLILWQKRPGTLKERTFFESVFGDPDSPGYVRKFVHFFRYFRFANVKFGDAIDLRAHLADIKGQKLVEEGRRIRWVLRHYLYRERKAVQGPQERGREHVMGRIDRHVELQNAIARWSQRTGKSIDEGRALARKYIQEIVPDRRWPIIWVLDHVMRVIFKAFYSGIIYDEAQMERVRKAAKDHPVVYVPGHRSHMDYLVLNWLLYSCDVAMPFICAGINLNFWPVGPLFRRSGAYFIRRSYPEPEIYPTVLNRYIRELLSSGQPQMFFIEGGRSRTGKTLRPKLGILSKVVDGFRANVAKDVMVVPVSIGYDRVLEEKAYSDEAAGGEKSREDLGALVRFLRKLFRSRFGKIYLYFDEPISMAQYFQENSPENALNKLANRICFGINRVSVVFPAALVALILLSHRKRNLSRVELSERAQPLIRYLERRKVRFSDVFFNREYAFESALNIFGEVGMIKVVDDTGAHFYSVDESKRLPLNFYKNNIVHFFVSFSLLAATLKSLERRHGEGQALAITEVEALYDSLRTLLEGEFFFRPKEAQPAYVQNVLEFFREQGDLELHEQRVIITAQGRKSLAAYQEIIFNFLESYGMTLLAARQSRGQQVDEKDLLRTTLGLGRRLYVQGKLERLEALSKFTLQNAIHSLIDKGVLQKTDRKGILRVSDDDKVLLPWISALDGILPPEFFADSK